MNISRVLALAGLLVTVAPAVSFADCNPPCKGNRVCRYDSTHNPPFFCRKPPAAAVAQQAPSAVNRSEPPKRGSQYQEGGHSEPWQRKAAAPKRPVGP
jgi:hypothetical protein